MKKFDKNEQCLLKFISSAGVDSEKDNGILNTIIALGIKPRFEDFNPIYQIIDELNYSNLIGK